MRFDFALAVNLAHLANSVAGVQQPIHCSSSTSQFRTANYITHGLPQQCLPSPYSSTVRGIADSNTTATSSLPAESPESTVLLSVTEVREIVTSANFSEQVHKPVEIIKESPLPTDDNDSPLDNANFLSFDEWRKQNLAKAGQSSEDLRERAPREVRRQPGTGSINDLDSLGEDAEIELNFGFGINDAPPNSQYPPKEKPAEPVAPVWQTRPKMAGKTGKERTNYASFDCAATVHKTNKEVKGSGSSAILVENKDSYMLNECRAENKFVIVELCDDILVDTVVLANYEFFSSIFRTFRVSVSDKYPVKASGWKELAVFEGRNSREIQAFLVEDPQIWARYLKIDFLTHYGNEFYCPISLLRVHGTTMMEEFLASTQKEAARGIIEDDVDDDIVEVPNKPHENTANKELEVADEKILIERSHEDEEKTLSEMPSNTEVLGMIDVYKRTLVTTLPSSQVSAQCRVTETAGPLLRDLPVCTAYTSSSSVSRAVYTDKASMDSHETISSPTIAPDQEGNIPEINDQHSHSLKSHTAIDTTTPAPTQRRQTEHQNQSQQEPPHRHNGSPVMPQQPSPTQESIYKTIHKRLQFLEANSTLSLQYIEDQSRMLRDAFAKVEKRQNQKQTTFMENLNATLRQELSEYV